MSNEAPDSAAHLAVERIAPLLPAQGPIGEFIHHNPLHAYERLPFEEAVVVAGERLGCAPFLPEDRYRAALAGGRIASSDLDAVLITDLGARGDETIARLVTRLELRRRVAAFGIPEVRGPALTWLLGETEVLTRHREDLPPSNRDPRELRPLWEACLAAVRRAGPSTAADRRLPSSSSRARRHRDALLAAYGIDGDEQVHPVLIRFVSAYLDQGLAHWPLPLRERGMHGCFLETYGAFVPRRHPRWGAELRRLAGDDRAAQRSGASSLARSLEALGVPPEEWEAYLAETVLALRGWAGMVRQIEERPDRVPARPLPATLIDFLAVRLLLERAVLTAALREVGRDESLAELPAPAVIPLAPPSPEERAWPLFHLAQLCEIEAATLERTPGGDIEALEAELADFDGTARRRVLHLAYERALRHRFYDALTAHEPAAQPETPAYQAIFCIDEREESFRRHLEEIDEGVETFGSAGFFGVAMYYQSATDAHPRPLCPVAIKPTRYVGERHVDLPRLAQRWQHLRERGMGLVDKNIHLGSRTLVRGTIVMLLGVISIIPLVLRVVFPWLGRRLAHLALTTPALTRLELEPTPEPPPIGERVGFDVAERAAIVRDQLETLGIAGRMAPLVLVIGHGSTSLNNPHESAHDCGACGGGHGGPNARAFAQMANDPRVRALLANEWPLRKDTWFVGAERNTASNSVTFFDEDRIPQATRPCFDRARSAVEEARQREAHERCRRFAGVPSWFPPRAALLHVEARSADLAQPRPEYGHATNAFCFVGRRATTKGLFLDRRAFLVSYDASQDEGGRSLARLLTAVVPVVTGINLEYYFGTVDPTGYGCGTKLPHNVTALLGVMDGAQSDLRTGLPWQMVEIHEPVRLAMVVEAPREVVGRVIDDNAAVRRLVDNRWLFVACLDGGVVWERHDGTFRRHGSEHSPFIVHGVSADYYRGARGPLGFARISNIGPAACR